MTGLDLAACLAGTEAPPRAGVVLAEWRDKFTIREKGRADFVTEADVAAQQVIRDCLAANFPSHEFLGEEGEFRSLLPGDQPTWIVDPIDGTTNYVHDIPFYCVSIGLWSAGEFVAGVVYDPRHDELFRAAKGMGAWLGTRRLNVTRTATLSDALLAVGFPVDMAGHADQLAWWNYFSFRCRGLRRTGSSALNLAYVAAGRFDAFYGMDFKVWDVAAGIVLVQEAGGIASRICEGHYDPERGELLTANAKLHEDLQRIFRESPAEFTSH